MDLGISALNYINSIKNGEFTVEEFTLKSLERISQVDEKLHAFLRVNDLAIKNAREIDTKIKSNQNVGKCYGMPVSEPSDAIHSFAATDTPLPPEEPPGT